jgi:hypothetical protein
MSTATGIYGPLRNRAPRWVGLVLAIAAVVYIAVAAIARTGADPAPAGTSDPGPSVTYPSEHRGDFHDGVVRRGSSATDEGFRGGAVKRG